MASNAHKDKETIVDDDDVAVASNHSHDFPDDTARIVDKIAERQLCRKLDFRLMPVLAIMCKWTIKLRNREEAANSNFWQTCSMHSTRATLAMLRQSASAIIWASEVVNITS